MATHSLLDEEVFHRSLLIAIALTTLLAGAAVAAPSLKAPSTAMPPVAARGPGDTCAEAIPIQVGDVVLGEIATEGDWDYYALTIDTPMDLFIHTVLDSTLDDSEMYLYDESCATELGYNDDGDGYALVIIHHFDQPGTYKIAVLGYDNESVGIYHLAVEEVTLAPVADTCQPPTSLPSGDFLIAASTTGLADDYAVSLGGYTNYGEGAPDAAFGLVLPDGENFSCNLVVEGDFVLYLVTDCGDPSGSLVEFSDDDPEAIDYTNTSGAGQTLYLIVDGYSSFDVGGFILSGHNGGSGLVANENTTWSGLKVRYGR